MRAGFRLLGDCRRGTRVVWDDSGRTAKVLDQSSGSTTVKIAGKSATIGERSFTTSKTETWAPGTWVRLASEGWA